jgi:hypothetical protein
MVYTLKKVEVNKGFGSKHNVEGFLYRQQAQYGSSPLDFILTLKSTSSGKNILEPSTDRALHAQTSYNNVLAAGLLQFQCFLGRMDEFVSLFRGFLNLQGTLHYVVVSWSD